MNKKAKAMIAAILIAASLQAQDATMTYSRQDDIHTSGDKAMMNVFGRNYTSLDGIWDILVDQYDNGFYDYRMKPMPDHMTFFADDHFYKDKTRRIEYDFDVSDKLEVPGDWNTQDPRYYYYEGSIWYRKVFQAKPQSGKRYFVYFEGANYEAIVGFNGKIIGRHVGGFTPFSFEVTDLLKDGSNSLIVKVNNTRHVEGIPTINCDWWNYGGITRSVKLVETPATFVREYSVSLSDDGKSIEGWIQLDGSSSGDEISIEIPELKYRVLANADGNGFARFSHKSKPQLWSPDCPKIYNVSISTPYDTITDGIGFRTITVDGTKILLNGEPIFLRGICIHEETMDERAGRAFNEEQAEKLLDVAEELGCNFLRLAHYPHNENMVRLAEKRGFLIWSEIPVYWTISWNNPDTYANAQNQLEEMITRDRNRAAIIIWSVANETPRSPERLEFLSRLIDRAHEMDGTRLVSAAMEKDNIDAYTVTVNDELIEKTDIISFNQYVGWYDGNPDKCAKLKWVFPVEKPVVITELGGGALYGFHGSRDECFTEEHLVYLYEEQTRMLDKIEALAGTTPWILKDFRSPRRQLKGIQDEFNRKGLMSDTGEKKMAFDVLKAWYETKR